METETRYRLQEQRREKEEESFFTCKICMEQLSSNMKFKNNIKNRCVHSFCTNCIANYIDSKLQIANIKCPWPKCDRVLDPITCQSVIPARVFERWCESMCEWQISHILGFERCYCPHKDCLALVVNECGGHVEKAKCPNCKKMFCFQCKVPWHEGYKCKEIRDNNDILFEDLTEKKKWVRCPQCKYCVELAEGCNKITCKCQTTFCYGCGKKYDSCKCGSGLAVALFVLFCTVIFYGFVLPYSILKLN